jgi:opacity protein-like surface antigen
VQLTGKNRTFARGRNSVQSAAWRRNGQEPVRYFEARIDYSDADPINGGFPYRGQASVTRSGWTVGGGVEYAFLPNWSAFAEYNYIDLGNRNVSLTYSCTGTCSFQNPYTYTVSHNISEFLVGINYRFGLPMLGHY